MQNHINRLKSAFSAAAMAIAACAAAAAQNNPPAAKLDTSLTREQQCVTQSFREADFFNSFASLVLPEDGDTGAQGAMVMVNGSITLFYTSSSDAKSKEVDASFGLIFPSAETIRENNLPDKSYFLFQIKLASPTANGSAARNAPRPSLTIIGEKSPGQSSGAKSHAIRYRISGTDDPETKGLLTYFFRERREKLMGGLAECMLGTPFNPASRALGLEL